MALASKKYQIIYADPPWSYNDKMSGHSFSLDHEYITQSKDWIKKLQIENILDKNCILFLWWDVWGNEVESDIVLEAGGL